MKIKYILIAFVASLLTISCSKKDSICGIWFEAQKTGSTELTLHDDGRCLLSLDDNFTEGIDKEINGIGQETMINYILTMKVNIIPVMLSNLTY
ncbi:hypothetical protein [Bacteroides acidifaciens]|uniref:hypothetical protein n=1 Tax=Bacteroides acidifaciens TaxID=85831 RepID=UPI0025582612|nr:hypothetical protein [Bacteroides acidifaciens]